MDNEIKTICSFVENVSLLLGISNGRKIREWCAMFRRPSIGLVDSAQLGLAVDAVEIGTTAKNWDPEFAADAERDFGLIFDHLLRSYLYFGESLESALDHAEARILEIARLRNAS